MRRRGPRPLGAALERVAAAAAPPGLLPRVQGLWNDVAGSAVAAEAEPVAERDGIVTVACRSAAWAHELELLAGDLLARLNERLGGAETVVALRFRTAPRRRA